MPRSPDPLPESAAATPPAATESSAHATLLDAAPPEPATASAPSPPLTHGDTQISQVHPGLPGEPHSTTLSAASSGLLRGPEGDVPRSGLTGIDERFRAIEHRLDQLDARMRLLEKGLERAPNGRAALLWWGVLALLVLGWAFFGRAQ